MPENVNVSALACSGLDDENDTRDVMVEVDHVSMIFNMASEKLNNLKEYAIALARRELMFKEFYALDDISFQVKRGDVFGILGTNGSGKSTILKIIAGVLEPSKGSCRINGNIAPLIELGAGFDMELTARENIYLNGALLGYSKKFIDEHFDEIVDFAEVSQFLDMPMKNYSSGMVARIAFAIATVIVPEILIVDEVLSVGDFMFQKKCEDRISKLIKEYGVTVLIVSHNNDQIERLCNKAVWIEKGHLRMAGSAKEVCHTYRILGGHTGSAESEGVVFDALTSPVQIDKSCIETLEADTRYGLAAKIMASCYPDGADRAILVSGERDMDAFLAMGLAGGMDCPILLTKGSSLPDSTIQELKRIAPKEIIFINSGDCSQRTMKNEVCGVLPDALYCEIYGTEYDDLSVSIFEFGNHLNVWGSTAVVTWVGCTGDLISLSPFIFSEACPVFLKYYDKPLRESQYRIFKNHGFKQYVVLAGNRALPKDDFESVLGENNIVRLLGNGPYLANREIDSWLTDSDNQTVSHWIVTSVEDFGFSLVLGVYCAKFSGRLMLCDPSNLDAVASSIKRIHAERSITKSILFAGRRGHYGTRDMELLAKALI